MQTQHAEEITISTAHLELSGLTWGDVAAQPVLALHGWLDNAASFARLAPLLSGLRVIALDLPGHGKSQHRPPGAAYHFIDYIPIVVQAANALSLERFFLLGHSLGAGIGSIVAAIFPERIHKLALIEGLGPVTAQPAEAPDRLLSSMNKVFNSSGRELPYYASVNDAVRARHAVSDMQHNSAEILVKRNIKIVHRGYTWRTDPKLKIGSPLYMTEQQVAAFLRRITSATLLIRGASSVVPNRQSLARRCRRVSCIQIIDIPGGHHLHIDNPAPVAHAINTFFA